MHRHYMTALSICIAIKNINIWLSSPSHLNISSNLGWQLWWELWFKQAGEILLILSKYQNFKRVQIKMTGEEAYIPSKKSRSQQTFWDKMRIKIHKREKKDFFFFSFPFFSCSCLLTQFLYVFICFIYLFLSGRLLCLFRGVTCKCSLILI